MKKQSDGRYRTRVVVGHDYNGNSIVKYVSGRTKKELASNIEQLKKKYLGGEISAENFDVTADEWILRYWDTVRAPRIRGTNAESMRRQIERYIIPSLEGRKLRAVTFFDLQTILNSIESKGATLIGNVYSIIRASFALAAAQRIIDFNPATSLEKPKKQKQNRRSLTDEERAGVLKMISDKAPDHVMLALMYYTGMRRGEVLGLKWSDIDLRHDIINVQRDLDIRAGADDEVKTQNSLRDIPIPNELKSVLKSIQNVGSGYVITSVTDCSKPMSESTYKRHWSAIQSTLGSFDLTAHCFRHNYATMLYSAGVDVLTAQRILGHSDPTTTLRIYTKLEQEKKNLGFDAAKKVFENNVAEMLPKTQHTQIT